AIVRRIAGLGSHNLPGQASARGPGRPRTVVQPDAARLLVAVEPGVHHVLAHVEDFRELRDGVTPGAEQDHVRALRDPPDGAPPEPLERLPLVGRERLDLDHLAGPPFQRAATIPGPTVP